jgi:hypothetical protein
MTKSRVPRQSAYDLSVRRAARLFAGSKFYMYSDGSYSCTDVKKLPPITKG